MAHDLDPVIYHQLFTLEPTAQQQRMVEIVEAAIKNYAKEGLDKTTFEKIAKTCKLSRPLIHRYFKDKRAIFEMSIRYIRAHMQKMVIESIQKQTKTDQMLKVYVETTFEWLEKYPNHGQAWLLFFYFTGVDRSYKKLLDSLNRAGQERITALIQKGIQEDIFVCENPQVTAKWLQTMITGALVTLATENLAGYRTIFVERIVSALYQELNFNHLKSHS